MNTELLTKYVQLSRKKRVLSAQLDEVKQALAAQAETLLQEFADEGLEKVRVTVDGQPATVYPKEDAWPRLKADVDIDEATAVLERYDLGYVVVTRADGNKLRSWASECRKQGVEIPPDLRNILTMNEKYTIGVSIN